MPSVDVSVAILTCDRPDDLRAALASLVNQETGGRFAYEVVVVDDGTGDGTGAVVREVAAGAPVVVRAVRTSKVGVARARNAGTAAARGAWIACFDDDQWAAPDWLAQLLATAAEEDALCVGGARTLTLPPGDRPPLSRTARVLLGEHDLPAGVRHYPADRRELPNTGNALIHRSVFERVGGFDPSFQGGSDTDFFWRVAQAGFVIAHAPGALAAHIIPESRLAPSYLRWVARKVGAATARTTLRNEGPAHVFGALVKRAAVTVGRDVPRYALRTATGNQSGRLDTSCAMAYSWAYARAALAFAVPSLFGTRRYKESLDFRRHGGERADVVA